MKIIATEDKIVVLNNVKNVTLYQDGTGSTRNPFEYWINIEYFKNESSSIQFGKDEKKAKETLKEIAEILSRND